MFSKVETKLAALVALVTLITVVTSHSCIALQSHSVQLSDSSGIYLTVDDYLKRKLSLAYRCGARKSRIKINSKPTISIVRHSVRHRFYKNEIFGFKKCGVDYRLYAGEYFEILSSKWLYLYKYTYEEEVGRNVRILTKYYFSQTAESILFPLTRHYLEWVFRDNKKLIDFLRDSVNAEDLLIQLDKFTNMYYLRNRLDESVE